MHQNTSKYIKMHQNTSKHIKMHQNISKHDEIKQNISKNEKATTTTFRLGQKKVTFKIYSAKLVVKNLTF